MSLTEDIVAAIIASREETFPGSTNALATQIWTDIVDPIVNGIPLFLNGPGAPDDDDTGKDGDFYMDTSTDPFDFYGPKTGGVWGDPVSFGGGGSSPVSVSVLEAGFTPSAGFGTVTNQYIYMQLVGDKLHVWGSLTNGTAAASVLSITIPAPYAIDYSKAPAGVTTKTGWFETLVPSSGGSIFASPSFGVSFMDGTDANKIYFSYQTASSAFVKVNGNTILNNNAPFVFDFEVPVTGYVPIPVADADEKVFSTSETIIGTWVDSRPIYRKVLTMAQALGTVGYYDTAHGITGLSGSSELIASYGKISDATYSIMITSFYGAVYADLSNGGNFRFYCAQNLTGFTLDYVVLDYVK